MTATPDLCDPGIDSRTVNGRQQMTDVTAVIIPFFQREPGILARAIASIDAQRLATGHAIDVIVVDDASPRPAAEELSGFSTRDSVSVRIIRQANGGAAAARNTGLDAVSPGTRWVAFLDSDDIWGPDHLARAHRALASGAAMYFADNWVEPGISWFAEFPAFESAIGREFSCVNDADRVYKFAEGMAVEAFINACLGHLSTIVLDAALVALLRMDEQLRFGEDHLFLVDAASRTDHIVFSRCRDVSRGHGSDLFRSTLDWNHPSSAERAFCAMVKYCRMKEIVVQSPRLRTLLNAKIAMTRRELIFLIVRNARRFPQETFRVLRRAIAFDPAILASGWRTLPELALAKMRGKLDFRT